MSLFLSRKFRVGVRSVALVSLCSALGTAQATLVGDTVQYEGWYPSRGSIFTSKSFVVEAGPADSQAFGGASFNVEAQSIEITYSGTGIAGSGPTPCNCIYLSDLDPGFEIGGYSVSKNLPGLTSASIEVTSSSFLFDFQGVTFGTNETITVNLLPVPEPSTYALILAGLGLVGSVATRRRKQ